MLVYVAAGVTELAILVSRMSRWVIGRTERGEMQVKKQISRKYIVLEALEGIIVQAGNSRKRGVVQLS
jgi:hypothetical protein